MFAVLHINSRCKVTLKFLLCKYNGIFLQNSSEKPSTNSTKNFAPADCLFPQKSVKVEVMSVRLSLF